MRDRFSPEGLRLEISFGNARRIAAVAALLTILAPVCAAAQDRTPQSQDAAAPAVYIRPTPTPVFSSQRAPVAAASRSLSGVAPIADAIAPPLPGDLSVAEGVVHTSDPNWIADFYIKVGTFTVDLDSDNPDPDPRRNAMAMADVVVSLHHKF